MLRMTECGKTKAIKGGALVAVAQRGRVKMATPIDIFIKKRQKIASSNHASMHGCAIVSVGPDTGHTALLPATVRLRVMRQGGGQLQYRNTT